MAFKIVDDIPMPRMVTGTTKYDFGRMEVGQCMVLDADTDKWARGKAVKAAYAWGKINGRRKFSGRTLADGRYGIWRVE